MSGIELEPEQSSSLPIVSLFLAVISAALLTWAGPIWVYPVSGLGFVMSVVSFVRFYRLPPLARRTGLPGILIGVHAALILGAGALQVLFLTPLAPSSAKLPKFRHVYVDPDNLFELRGPLGWDYTRMMMGSEVGVRIQPVGRDAYMGVSELSVLVRKLDRPPASPQALLDKMAAGIVEGRKKTSNSLFQFDVKPATLLDGGHGVWATLDLKRLWVPLHQVSLLGVKQQRYLCSVSATGLKSHDSLSDLVCLGLFETLKFNDPNVKQPLKKK